MGWIQRVQEAIDRNRTLILDAERYLWEHPETGYHEWKAHAYLKEKMEAMGYEVKEAGNIPGFYAELDLGKAGPCVAVLGEMDALTCPEHPCADPETGAVHACGHHTQCAALLGVAAALREPGVTDGLCGKIKLMAVPAEEIIELEFRESLVRQGVVRYLQGKPEFICRGYFDDVDMAMLIHAGKQTEGTHLKVRNGPTCGCIVKKMTFIGKAAHAGARPQEGINALYAATTAIAAANAIRERFPDDEHIRFHPIITEGGGAINVIPDRVVVESYLRGARISSMETFNQAINNAFAGAAAAFGARLEITDWPGALPMKNEPMLRQVAKEAMELLEGPGTCLLSTEMWSPGGTDMGNLSALMPVVQPSSSGVQGAGHSKDFMIADPELTCVVPAACLTTMLHLLLQDDAKRAAEITAGYQPAFPNTTAYIAALNALSVKGEVVRYEKDGSIVIHCASEKQLP
ncbi:MAG: amidohydrolase [Pseudoflavonifractor capillosus]|uniref:amidohydrolase n=1 Tax=Pseudoflavonifractor capillosus TaxID=106588 RepID=UPI0023F93EDF|nr:amidohydrolase [Pseudoflavonifractor capillosus]MCI5928029.1 amidohydrolase [Pseudoflavonifractor capillosus]MDY4662123.1 amidohydrolase [Pseudoflavonifractor capillosus]